MCDANPTANSSLSLNPMQSNGIGPLHCQGPFVIRPCTHEERPVGSIPTAPPLEPLESDRLTKDSKDSTSFETDTKAISVRTVDQLPVGISVGHNPSLAALCC